MNTKNGDGARAYDVIVWGATGYTGKLVAEYLAKHYGVARDLRWAIGGRSEKKLEEVRRALAAIDPAAKDLAIVTTDASDPKGLAEMVKKTRVVATTVGPYALYGKELVAACVDAGTAYCDLTGETQFVREMVDLHHARAKTTGARIVHCCGFDFIPSDLGVLILQDEMRARFGVRAREVRSFVGPMRGGMSGGTVASGLNIMAEASKQPGLLRLLDDPYALDPDRREPGPDGPDQRSVRWDDELGRWTGPFIMAAINTRVVRRSNAVLGYAYGKDFSYSECMCFSRGPKGWVSAAGLTAGIGAFMGVAQVGPLRRLLEKTVLPAPGEGPSREERERGFFHVHMIATGEKGQRYPPPHRGPRRSRLRRDLQDARRVRGVLGQRSPPFRGRHPHPRVMPGRAPRGAAAQGRHALRRGGPRAHGSRQRQRVRALPLRVRRRGR